MQIGWALIPQRSKWRNIDVNLIIENLRVLRFTHGLHPTLRPGLHTARKTERMKASLVNFELLWLFVRS